jgi:hypothetical protein
MMRFMLLIRGDPLVDVLLGSQMWIAQERITLQTINPLDTGTREVLSCESCNVTFEDVCATALAVDVVDDFGLASFFWDQQELHVTASSNVLFDPGGPIYSPVTTVIDYVVPIRASAWLFGSALIGLAAIKRKK